MPVSKNGITVDPSTGSGNTQLSVSATADRGNRVTQSATFKVATPGDGPSDQFTANHVAAAEFITPTSMSPAVPKDGGNVTITGTANSPVITFAKGNGEIIEGEIATISYTANGSAATSGTEITGDPGATAKYTWSVSIPTTENPTVETRSQTITISGDSMEPVTITLQQAVGDAELSLNPDTVNIPQAGTAQTIQVTTNTTFTVTAV